MTTVTMQLMSQFVRRLSARNAARRCLFLNLSCAASRFVHYLLCRGRHDLMLAKLAAYQTDTAVQRVGRGRLGGIAPDL